MKRAAGRWVDGLRRSRNGSRLALAFGAAIAGALLCVVIIGLASASGAPKATLTLVEVGAPPPAAEQGEKIVFTGVVRNRSGRAQVGRVSVSLRTTRRSRNGLVIASKLLPRLRAHRRASFKVTATLGRTLPRRAYTVTLCVRVGRGTANCKSPRRSLRIVATRPGAAPGVGREPAPGAGGGSIPPAPGQGPGSPAEPPRGAVYQTIGGFGSSERVFDDPHVYSATGPAPSMTVAQQDQVLEALYGELGLTRVRAVMPETTAGPPPVGIEVANDNGDPRVTDPTRFDFSGRRLDAHAALLKRIEPRGVAAWISPLNREAWMGVTSATDVAEYAEWLLAQVRRFKQQGAPLQYISVANEPSYSRNTMSGEFVRDVIKNLGPRLAAEGLSVPFVIPDDVRASNGAAKASTVLADPVARQYVGALATHLYDEPLSNVSSMQALAKAYKLPLWMTESAMGAIASQRPRGAPKPTPLDWALLMHELLATYDVSAIDYFWGYIGQRAPVPEEGSLITINQDSSRVTGFTRNKTFYYFGQYSRFVRPGALRVSVTSSDPRIKVSAYYLGGSRVLVAINPTASAVETTLSAEDLAGVSALTPVSTSATQNLAQLPTVAVSGTGVSVSLAAGSVTTLTGTAAARSRSNTGKRDATALRSSS